MSGEMRSALVLVPFRGPENDLCDALRQARGVHVDPTDSGCVASARGLELRFEFVETTARALNLISQSYFNLLLVDCRNCEASPARATRRQRSIFDLLEALRREPDRERRYPFRRILALVGDCDEERADRLIFSLGERHVGACIRDRSVSLRGGRERAAGELRQAFAERLWEYCYRTLVERRRGKKAVCAAGGGISGVYYELGVLKCLHDSFDLDIDELDLYFGISAGALVTAGLANGLGIDRLIAILGGLDGSGGFRLRLGWRHLNVGAVPKRLVLVQKALVRYLRRTLRREDDFSVASILGTYATALGPLFDNGEFEQGLRRLFTSGGRTNDFRELRRALFIGATDQDRRDHVLFGGAGFDHVPISKAVQASAAIHPFFPSVEIDGRYYTDGIVTRTTNLRTAIDMGADLVFVIDPFLPLISDRPGFNAQNGNMWIVEQDYKTMSHTRYEQARNEILRRNSQVNVYTFVPSNRMRHLMSGQNPFVSRNFHAIVCEAYRSTYRRLCQLEYKMSGELASHGITLDLEPVERTAQRLATARRPNVRTLLDGRHDGRRRAGVA
jgi:NTE family protein